MGWTTQPYAYAGNNPLLNVDPSGQRFAAENAAQARAAMQYHRQVVARMANRHARGPQCSHPRRTCLTSVPGPISGHSAPAAPSSVPYVGTSRLFSLCTVSVLERPAWCGRYFDYGGFYPRFRWTAVDMMQHHDYWFLLVGAQAGVGVQEVLYYLGNQRNPVFAVGVSAGFDLGLAGSMVLGFGFGLLLTEGNPGPDQVEAFLKGWTRQGSLGIIFGMTIVYSPSQNGFAWETTVSSSVGFSGGFSYGWLSGPPECGDCIWQPGGGL